MEVHNKVLLQKTAWRFLTEPNSLWVRLLKSKYGIPDDIVSFVSSHASQPLWSFSWRGLFGALKELASGLKWHVGNGSQIRFWTDHWLDKPIVNVLDEAPPYMNSETRVIDFIADNGQWNYELLFAQLPLEVVMSIIGYPLPRVHTVKDSYYWAYTANGKFNTRSTYLKVLHDEGVDLSGDFRWLWKLPIPARWIYFIWLAWRGRLVTNSLRASWGLDVDTSCSLCDAQFEDVLHVLRDCVEAKGIWEKLIPVEKWHLFFNSTLEDWLLSNLDGVGQDWKVIVQFATAIWRIWTQRCKRIFQEDDLELDHLDLIRNILLTTSEVCATKKVNVVATVPPQNINWVPPAAQAVKLNTDGAACGNPGIAGAGGLLRDSAEHWLVGFAAHLCSCSNIAAELHALRLGLLMAWNEGYRHVECEVDAKVVLELVSSADVQFHPLGTLIADIRDLLRRSWVCCCTHTLREGNSSADRLSKMGCSIDDDYIIFRQPPQEVMDVLLADCRGIAYPRGFKM